MLHVAKRKHLRRRPAGDVAFLAPLSDRHFADNRCAHDLADPRFHVLFRFDDHHAGEPRRHPPADFFHRSRRAHHKLPVTAAYASPILFALGGRRHLVNYSSHQAFGVDADTGKLLWRLPWPSGESLIGPMPVFDRNAVLVSSSARNGGATVRIELAVGDQGVEAKSIWTSPVDDMHGGSVLVGGRLYGSGHVNEPHLVCLDPQTGKVLYRAADLPRGAVLWAQGRLYFLALNGAMSLLEPGVDGFAVRGQFQAVTPKKKDAWTHPVICHGRLYLRYHDTLYCYDIKDE